jgi:hypothetical protein
MQVAEHYWDRILDKLRPTPKGCLEWEASCTKTGYGVIGIGGRKGTTMYVHRLVFELFNGIIPAGMYVCHRCDNPKCARPEHLFLGTQHDNMRDCKSKGRAKWSVLHGISHPNSRLTEKDVLFIRHSGYTLQELADLLKVSVSTVHRVRSGSSYKTVKESPLELEWRPMK